MASSGNFATIGGLEKNTGGFTFSQGNLKYSVSTNNRGFICSAGFPDTGKWYYEMYIIGVGGTQDQVFMGVCNPDTMRANLTQSRGGAQGSYGGYVFDNYDGKAYLNGTAQSADGIGYFRSFPQKIGILVNRDDNEIKWTLNGSDLSSAYTIPTGPLYPYIGSGGGSTEASGVFNFGQDSTFGGAISAGGNSDSNGFGDFTFSVPSNYVALTSANLPISDDIDPAQTDSDYPQKQFFISQYSGNGTNRTITTEAQPDLIFIRSYNGTQDWYTLDSSRGITDNKYLLSNTTAAEATLPQSNFTSVGATSVGISSGTWLNSSGSEYQMWMWKCNGGTTASNSEGDITSTVQASQKAGFSIVEYTGDLTSSGNRTVGHGLSKAPEFIIRKGLNTERWAVSHVGCTSFNEMLELNTNAAEVDKSGNGSMSAPTTTVFSNNYTDGYAVNGTNYIAYCWHSVVGYSSFGSYVGNGNADGPFIYTGGRPALVVTKRIDGSGSWLVHDNKRDTYNPVKQIILWDDSQGQFSGANDRVDFLSNGFKVRSSNTGINGSGNDYIYMCWMDVPFKYNNTF